MYALIGKVYITQRLYNYRFLLECDRQVYLLLARTFTRNLVGKPPYDAKLKVTLIAVSSKEVHVGGSGLPGTETHYHILDG